MSFIRKTDIVFDLNSRPIIINNSAETDTKLLLKLSNILNLDILINH